VQTEHQVRKAKIALVLKVVFVLQQGQRRAAEPGEFAVQAAAGVGAHLMLAEHAAVSGEHFVAACVIKSAALGIPVRSEHAAVAALGRPLRRCPAWEKACQPYGHACGQGDPELGPGAWGGGFHASTVSSTSV